MILGKTTVDLWKRSLPWRAVVICAAVSTVLAVMSGGSPTQQAGPSVQAGPPQPLQDLLELGRHLAAQHPNNVGLKGNSPYKLRL